MSLRTNQESLSDAAAARFTVICEQFWVSRSSAHSHRMRKEFGISWSKYAGDDNGVSDSSLKPNRAWIPVSTRAAIKASTLTLKIVIFLITLALPSFPLCKEAELHPLCQDWNEATAQELPFGFSIGFYWLVPSYSFPTFLLPSQGLCNYAAFDRASLESSDPHRGPDKILPTPKHKIKQYQHVSHVIRQLWLSTILHFWH